MVRVKRMSWSTRIIMDYLIAIDQTRMLQRTGRLTVEDRTRLTEAKERFDGLS